MCIFAGVIKGVFDMSQNPPVRLLVCKVLCLICTSLQLRLHNCKKASLSRPTLSRSVFLELGSFRRLRWSSVTSPHSPPSFPQRWRAKFRPRNLTPAEMECAGVAAARQPPRRHPASPSLPLAPPLHECSRRAHPPQAPVRAPPSHGSGVAGRRAPFLF
jgi:hypothetical protein